MANVSSFSGAMPVIPGGTVELGYSPITSAVTVDNATAGTGKEIIAPLTVVCDGSPVLVEFFSQNIYISAPNVGDTLDIALWVDGAEQDRFWARKQAVATGSASEYVYTSRRLTPSAGSHTFSVRGVSTAAARPWVVNAGSGGTAAAVPAFLRVSKIVNQNDGLKPFWTPPVVTQLPSQATVGDQVIYAADASNGVYWQLQYDGLGTYPWKFIGGAPLVNEVTSSQSTTSTSNVDLATVGPSLTLALAGDYISNASAQVENNTSGSYCCYSIFVNGVASGAEMQARMGSASQTLPTSIDRNITGSAANATVKLMYRAAVSGTANFVNRRLTITPIRVKAA